MDKPKKTYTLFLILIVLASSLWITQTVNAQSISKPSAPEFTVKLVAYPYDVPSKTSTTIDPYTGKEIVTTQPGYHIENKSIEVRIRNQPFTSYTDEDGHQINIFYNIRVKGHFSEVWKELYPNNLHREVSGYDSFITRSNSEYTVVSTSAEYPKDAQLDYQVQARQGYHNQVYPFLMGPSTAVFTGTVGDWSNTQTLILSYVETNTASSDQTSPTPTIQPTPTLTQPPAPILEPTQNPIVTSGPIQPIIQKEALLEFRWEQIALAVMAAIIVALAFALLLLHRRSLKP